MTLTTSQKDSILLAKEVIRRVNIHCSNRFFLSALPQAVLGMINKVLLEIEEESAREATAQGALPDDYQALD